MDTTSTSLSVSLYQWWAILGNEVVKQKCGPVEGPIDPSYYQPIVLVVIVFLLCFFNSFLSSLRLGSSIVRQERLLAFCSPDFALLPNPLLGPELGAVAMSLVVASSRRIVPLMLPNS